MCRSQQAVWIFLLWVFSLNGVYAATPTCSAVFPDGVQTNSNSGRVLFEWGAKVIDSPDNIIETKRLDDSSGGSSCNTTSCGYTGSAAESMDYNTFPNNNNDVVIGYNQSRTLLPGNYDDIRLDSGAVATFTPGDYRLRGALYLRSDSQLRINGSGVVRILMKGKGRLESGADINPGGDASRIIIYSRNEIELHSNTTVTGFVYAKNTVRLHNRAEVNGAVSGKNVELKSSSSKVTYLPSALSSASFGDLCGGGPVTPPPPPPAATGCAAIWPDGVQSHSNSGEVKFEWNSRVINSPDNVIDAAKIKDESGGVSCVDTTCTASFSPSPEIDFSGFISSGGSDFDVDYKQTRTISPGTYKDIELKGQATLIMEAGDYYVTDDVKIQWDSDIQLPASGVVRMFIDDKFESEGRGTINSNGNPEQLLILARGDIKFKNTDDVKAFVYSLKDVELGHGSDVVGAVSGKDVKLKSSGSTVTYSVTGVANTAFGEICSGDMVVVAEPIAEYRFDECTVESTLRDETGSYNAAAMGVATADNGVIGKALDLSADGTGDWVSLPRNLADGLNDFSVALWIKTSVNKGQQEILQALGSNTDDDELEIYLVNKHRIRFQVKDDDVNLDSSSSMTDGTWHHVVLTRQGARGCLYLDGSLQECDDDLGSGALSVPQSAFVLGQEQDAYGGGFSSSQSFEGLMDELKIYNRTLSASDISAIYSNEQAGNNSDGSSREAQVCEPETLEPWVDLRFDETNWSGAEGEIKDTSGNGNHGSIVDIVNGSNSSGNVTNIADGKICRAGHIGDNNSSSDIFAIDSGVDLNDLGSQHTVSFWYRPTDAWNDGLTRLLMDASATDSQIFYYLAKESDSKVEFGFENTSDSDYRQKSSSSFGFVAGTWVHIAASMDNTTNVMKAYVNGSKVVERSTSGTLGDIFSFYLGDNRSSYTSGSGTGRSANGDFDELLIFDKTLSDARIASIYSNQNNEKNWDGSDRECAVGSTVDHYGISVTTPALTCEAAEVTITAYDSSGNTVTPDSGTAITLSTDNPVDGWSLKTGNGSLSESRYTFDGSETSVVLGLMNTNPETININVTDGPVSESASLDPSVVFVDAAFRFSTIAAQISGQDGVAVTLSAIQTDADTGRCVVLQPNPAANVDVTFAYSCEDPSSCARAQDALTVAGVAVDSTAEGYTTVPVSFNSSGQATLNLNYSDAGQIKVHAAAELAVTGATTKASIAGSSNAFTVAPAGLCVEATDANAACATGDSTCSAFVAAGANFALKVSGRQWQAGESSPADYCDNGTTPNFKLEDIPLSHSVVAPSGGETGDLGVPVVSITSNGEATINTQTVSEVGVFTITAQPPAYFGADTIPDATSAAIGRFYPDRFVLSDVVLTNRADLSCSASDFSYMGENFQTTFKLTAQNSAGGQTKNYTGGFAKLDQQSELGLVLVDNPSGGTLSDLSSQQNVDSTTFSWPAVGETDLGQGTVTLNLSLGRGAGVDGPYSNVIVAIAPDDGDAQLNSFNIDYSGDGSNDHADAGDTEIRFGRMQIQNTYGPETASLNQPVFVQYFDGSNFVTSADDSCTPFATSNIVLQVEGESALAQGVVTNVDIGSGTTNLAIGSALASGEANLTYSAPGAGNTGTITNIYAVPDWLRFDWDGDGSHDDNPSATAIFGRYRGNDRVIYWLEQ
ncbi:LamG domain-containing protein [Pontibacterium granulatum]|uniref:LamG domain-containing protein n=1 Tax=Pontibacterium granulatum TaxID=2036029 RepID=UPI00249C98B5|nr:LamG domain-containing protein [Pontibacterium granulatum]MDI3324328.1 LamG domain-containing protein [Pontibacterium granulatum]